LHTHSFGKGFTGYLDLKGLYDMEEITAIIGKRKFVSLTPSTPALYDYGELQVHRA
jgi:hypothetical protein